jgi:hypothetical protein
VPHTSRPKRYLQRNREALASNCTTTGQMAGVAASQQTFRARIPERSAFNIGTSQLEPSQPHFGSLRSVLSTEVVQ